MVGAEHLPLKGAAVVIATEHGNFRFQLGADGEACVYNQWGDRVHLRQDRTIHLVAQAKVLIDTAEVEINASTSMTVTTPQFTVTASTGVTLTTPTVAASAEITAGADITATGEVADAAGGKTMSGMRSVYNAHTHGENDVGGPTDTPTGTM